MFESLFARPTAIARYRSAPLLNERLRYLAHCETLGIKPETLCKIAHHQLTFVRALNLQDGNDGLILTKIEAWYKKRLLPKNRTPQPRAPRRLFSDVDRWLRFLGWRHAHTAARHAYTREITDFATHVSDECGWSHATTKSCCQTVNGFFFWLDEKRVDLPSVDITVIDEFIANFHARGYCRSTINLYAQQIRSFLRYAEQRSWCMPGLAGGIMPPRRYPGESIPKGLDRDEVIRLLATTEGERSFDIRARAILMLLITYGLRAGEVSRLQLDDIDWERELMRVRSPKPGRAHLYPLSRGVGQTILRYLREVRPEQPDRTLFLTFKAPIRPLDRAVIKGIVSTRLHSLGITGKRRGPHALRHAAAQHLLDQGLSMKVIGDYLGHRSVAATSVYAKVQLSALREVAEINLEGLV